MKAAGRWFKSFMAGGPGEEPPPAPRRIPGSAPALRAKYETRGNIK